MTGKGAVRQEQYVLWWREKPFTAKSAALVGVFTLEQKHVILIALLWSKLLSKAS